MKTHLVCLISLLLLFWALPVNSQSYESKKWRVEFGIGLNLLGPDKMLADHMRQEGFDLSYNSWFGRINNPKSSKAGYSIMGQGSYHISEKTRIGIKSVYSMLGTARGESAEDGHVSVQFSNIFISPVMEWLSNSEKASCQIGPAIFFNQWKNNYWLLEEEGWEENQVKVTLGINLGGSVHLWNGQNTFGNLSLFYLWTYAQEFGPFSSEYKTDESALSATDLNFHSIQFTFSMGFKW